MDFIDESGTSANSSKLSEEDSVDQTASIVTRAAEMITDNLGSKEPSTGHGSMLDKSIISFSSGSQSSTDSYDTIFEPHNTNVRCSETFPNDQPAHSSPVNKHGQPYSLRSSCDASDITHESALMSLRQSPPLQVMDRSAAYDPGRISSSVFTAHGTPQEWSLASNESLFSLHVGPTGFHSGVLAMGDPSSKSSDFAVSDEVMSNRPSMVAGQETARSAFDKEDEQAGLSKTDNSTHDSIVQKIHERIDAKAEIRSLRNHLHVAKKGAAVFVAVPVCLAVVQLQPLVAQDQDAAAAKCQAVLVVTAVSDGAATGIVVPKNPVAQTGAVALRDPAVRVAVLVQRQYVAGTGVAGRYYTVGTGAVVQRGHVAGAGTAVLKDHAVNLGAVVLKDRVAEAGAVAPVGTVAPRKHVVETGIVVAREYVPGNVVPAAKVGNVAQLEDAAVIVSRLNCAVSLLQPSHMKAGVDWKYHTVIKRKL
ncbi:hypothetical protein QQ045_013216 [Rhodiola kirilowii]